MVVERLDKAVFTIDEHLKAGEAKSRQQGNEATVAVRRGSQTIGLRVQLFVANIRLISRQISDRSESRQRGNLEP